MELATLTDNGTEINTTVSNDITFIAQRNGDFVQICYKHNFPDNLTFSTSTIYWVPMVP